MKAVLMSIKPLWCERILSGEETVILCKTEPKMEMPFKVYIYCTKDELLTKSHSTGIVYIAMFKSHQFVLEANGNKTLSGKVIGDFVCDRIDISKDSNGKNIYIWHISDLEIYDTPKELCEFQQYCGKQFNAETCKGCKNAWIGTISKKPYCDRVVNHAPASWCYVEEIEE